MVLQLTGRCKYLFKTQFLFLWNSITRGISESYITSIFNILKSLYTVFCSEQIYISIKYVQEIHLLYIYANSCSCFILYNRDFIVS